MSLEAFAVSPAFSRALGLPDGSAATRELTPEEVGYLSEVKVATALLNHPDIARVFMTEHFGPDDMLSRDVIIRFRKELNRKDVFGEIKSSKNGVRIYNYHTRARLRGMGLDMTVEEYMAMNRRVVIIGNGNTHDEIKACFDQQLPAILAFHGEI